MHESRQKIRTLLKSAAKCFVCLAYGAVLRKRSQQRARDVKAPSRILLLHGAHIGDIVVATSVLPILRSAYPSVEIGMLTGSWSQMVVANHPDLTHTHCVDHWILNRADTSIYRKVVRFIKTRRLALAQLEQLKYDVAISMFPVFPDLMNLAWAAGIPVRIGYKNSIFSCLATDLVDCPESPFVHQSARFAELLRVMPIDSAHFRLRRSSLPPSDDSSIQEVCSLLGVSCIEGAKYRIIHMGSGDVRREFPVAFWREVSMKLSPTCALVFTGRGAREHQNIAAAVEGMANCVNACDRLSWGGFVSAVRHAEVVYGVESMAGHVAAAVCTKCAVVYAGMAGVAQWRPNGPGVVVFTNHVPCAPCHQPSGCKAMTCMQNTDPADLIEFGP